MTLEQKITAALAPALTGMGYDIVRVTMTKTQRPVLQIMIERANYGGLSMEECTEATQVISTILDVEDPLEGHYMLEVSSPGIDRPLVRPQDYVQFAGHEARLETILPVEGRRRFQGILRGTEPGPTPDAPPAAVMDLTDGGQVALPLDNVRRAKLVLTDALLKAMAPKRPRPDPADLPVLEALEDEADSDPLNPSPHSLT